MAGRAQAISRFLVEGLEEFASSEVLRLPTMI
jgi:hypothetical protein